MRKTKPKGIVLLVLTALIWGSSFVAQSIGIESVDAFTFMALRTILGSLILLPVVLFMGDGLRSLFEKKTLRAGIILGTVFAVAQNLQQFAFYYSTSGKIAFLTALYMFFVPIIGIFLGKKILHATWVSIFMALAGLFLLCMNPEDMTAINKGDILAISCGFVYAFQIMLIDKFTGENINGIRLSFLEFFTAAGITSIMMLIFEHPTAEGVKAAAPAIMYSGIMSCGIAYTLQVIGQKYASPVVASLIMCFESVFAALTGWLILKETLSAREIAGCAVMFAAIILSQVFESISMQKEAFAIESEHIDMEGDIKSD
ncbi:MAG: DMT family transporter [Clostridiales bacterium]|nr:DMT family transporter [Clostridiales bacterium]